MKHWGHGAPRSWSTTVVEHHGRGAPRSWSTTQRPPGVVATQDPGLGVSWLDQQAWPADAGLLAVGDRRNATCQNPRKVMEAAMRLGLQRDRAMMWVDDYLGAWNAHDAVAVTDFMTNDVVYTDFGLDEQYKGLDAVRDFVDGMELSFSTNYRFALGQCIVTPDVYSFEWTMSGTNYREDVEHDFPATGMRFKIPGISIGALRNGKIKDHRDYWNMTTYLLQVGLAAEG